MDAEYCQFLPTIRTMGGSIEDSQSLVRLLSNPSREGDHNPELLSRLGESLRMVLALSLLQEGIDDIHFGMHWAKSDCPMLMVNNFNWIVMHFCPNIIVPKEGFVAVSRVLDSQSFHSDVVRLFRVIIWQFLQDYGHPRQHRLKHLTVHFMDQFRCIAEN